MKIVWIENYDLQDEEKLISFLNDVQYSRYVIGINSNGYLAKLTYKSSSNWEEHPLTYVPVGVANAPMANLSTTVNNASSSDPTNNTEFTPQELNDDIITEI